MLICGTWPLSQLDAIIAPGIFSPTAREFENVGIRVALKNRGWSWPKELDLHALSRELDLVDKMFEASHTSGRGTLIK